MRYWHLLRYRVGVDEHVLLVEAPHPLPEDEAIEAGRDTLRDRSAMSLLSGSHHWKLVERVRAVGEQEDMYLPKAWCLVVELGTSDEPQALRGICLSCADELAHASVRRFRCDAFLEPSTIRGVEGPPPRVQCYRCSADLWQEV